MPRERLSISPARALFGSSALPSAPFIILTKTTIARNQKRIYINSKSAAVRIAMKIPIPAKAAIPNAIPFLSGPRIPAISPYMPIPSIKAAKPGKIPIVNTNLREALPYFIKPRAMIKARMKESMLSASLAFFSPPKAEATAPIRPLPAPPMACSRSALAVMNDFLIT